MKFIVVKTFQATSNWIRFILMIELNWNIAIYSMNVWCLCANRAHSILFWLPHWQNSKTQLNWTDWQYEIFKSQTNCVYERAPLRSERNVWRCACLCVLFVNIHSMNQWMWWEKRQCVVCQFSFIVCAERIHTNTQTCAHTYTMESISRLPLL